MKIIIMILSLTFIKCEARFGMNVSTSNTACTYKTICIEGHEYYEGHRRLSIKLDNNGRPINCEVKE